MIIFRFPDIFLSKITGQTKTVKKLSLASVYFIRFLAIFNFQKGGWQNFADDGTPLFCLSK
jgi:hypothetical protein